MKWMKFVGYVFTLALLTGLVESKLFSRSYSANAGTLLAGAGGNPYEVINEYRYLAGLPEFYRSRLLEKAASDHAQYLKANPVESSNYMDYHREKARRPRYTGERPADRAGQVGYPSSKVSENISYGGTSYTGSIENLMSAIYHRLGFLDFKVNEIGVSREGQIFVYDMGNRQLARICVDRPEYFAARKYLRCGDNLITEDDEDYICRHIPPEAQLDDSIKGLRCANGTLLDGEYLQVFCQSPPEEALLHGPGAYYSLCEGQYKVRKPWLDDLCRQPGTAAYQPSAYFTLSACPEVKIKSEWRDSLCEMAGTNDMNDAQFYPDLCHQNFKVSARRWVESERERLDQTADYVIWPPKEYAAPTRFTGEFPDPLPDIEVSGYPISIHFNPYTTEDVSVHHFSLYRHDHATGDWVPVNKVRRLDHRTDPNHMLTPSQFAWFPLEPLRAQTEYRVKMDVFYNEMTEKIEWTFVTQPR